MGAIAGFLGSQPFLALFLVIALGYAVGSITVRGFSLGVGAVLFSGLLVGAISPQCQPPAMVGTLGMVMFLYGLGVQYGRQFFQGLAGAAGRRYNALAFVSLAAATAGTVLAMTMLNVSRPMMAGLFTGCGTLAAAMQAALDAAKNTDPAVGFAVAFPFGLFGAILCMTFMQRAVKPDVEAASSRSGLETVEVAIRSPEAAGRTLGEVLSTLPEGVQVLAVRVGDENRLPDPGSILGLNDVLFMGSAEKAALDAAVAILGEKAAGRVVGDRTAIDHLRVFVSKAQLAGMRLADIRFPEGINASITHVERGDTEILVTPGLTLEIGDRVGLLADRQAFRSLRRFFGNSIRGTAELSYLSLGIGMVLGVLLGILPIPVPVLGTMKVGIAGGTTIVALVLGKLGRTGKLTWTIPASANLTLRNFGLTMLLAQVGMSTGAPFVQVIKASGLPMVAAAMAITLVLVLTPLLAGRFLFRIPFADLLGVTAGIAGSPAILAHAYRSYPSDRVEICYAMIFPTATILKIVVAQLLVVAGK